MLISHKYKIIFIHVHRTGGTTIANMLKQEMSFRVSPVGQHGNAQSVEVETLKKYPDYFKFGFVRNPWDRFLSWYAVYNRDLSLDDPQCHVDFEHFLERQKVDNPHDEYFHNNQMDYFTDVNGTVLVDKIARFENYVEEVYAIFQGLDLTLYEVPVYNETPTKNYRDYYSDKARMTIEDMCAKDIAEFNYQF